MDRSDSWRMSASFIVLSAFDFEQSQHSMIINHHIVVYIYIIVTLLLPSNS
jgi:hypothetical protein